MVTQGHEVQDQVLILVMQWGIAFESTRDTLPIYHDTYLRWKREVWYNCFSPSRTLLIYMQRVNRFLNRNLPHRCSHRPRQGTRVQRYFML